MPGLEFGQPAYQADTLPTRPPNDDDVLNLDRTCRLFVVARACWRAVKLQKTVERSFDNGLGLTNLIVLFQNPL